LFLRVIITALIAQFLIPAIVSAQDSIPKKRPERISVAYCSDCVPFHFQDEKGLPAGMLIDFWRLWSEKTGVEIDFRAAPWDDSLAMVGGGVADAHAGLFFNKERDEFLDYGSALRKTDTHVFIHKALPAVGRIEELSAYRIGVLAKDYVEGYLKKRLPKAIIVPYPDYTSIMMALKDGTLKVFAADTPTGIYHLQRNKLIEQFSFSKELLLYQNDWYAAAREGNAELIKTINEGMSQISQSEKTEIGRRWSAVSKEEKTDALLISMDRAYPPMTFLNAQGRPAGFLVDLWRLWSKKTGREIRFKENNWKESVEALRNGEADIHSGLFKNDERSQWLNFAPEVYRIGTGLYHRAGEKISDKPAEVKGQTIGIIAGSHQEIMARTRWPNLHLTQFNTTQELIQSLLEESVNSVLAEIPVMDVLLNKMGMRGEIVLKPEQLFVNAFHPAVLKERKKILKSVEQGFSRISQRELAMLEKRWIDDPAKRVYAQKFRLDSKAVPLNLTEEEKKWLKEHPVIRMGVDRSWAPFEFLDEMNQHTGIAADFMQLMEERLGIRFVPPPNISWEEVIAKTRKGELDILSVLAPTKEREKFLHFTNPYIQAPFVIVRRAGSPSISDLNDLSGQKVGVVSGYAAEEKVYQQAPHLNIVPAKDLSEGLLALSTGKTDAFVGNLPSVKHFIQILFLNNLEVGASAGFTLDLTIGVRKDWPVLTEILNKSIRSVTKEEKRKILRMESSEEIKEQGTDISLVKILIAVATLALILVAAIFFLNRYLKAARAKGLSEDIFQSSKIRAIGVGVIGLFISITVILAWVSIKQIDQKIRQDMGTTLSIILKSTQDSLRIWVQNRKQGLNQLLVEPELLKPVEILLDLPRNKEALVRNSAQELVRDFFKTRLEEFQEEDFFIISRDFINIGALREIDIGSMNAIAKQGKDLLKRVFQGEVVFATLKNSDDSFGAELGKNTQSDVSLFFVGPLRNGQGEIIAAVSIPRDPFRDFSRITQVGQFGTTAETYAFNKQGYFLTESRFKEQIKLIGLNQEQKSILSKRVTDPGSNLVVGIKSSTPIKDRPLTLMAQSAIKGTDGENLQGYRDYRGVPVLGAWLWDNVLGLGLATEIDLEEALNPYYSVRNIIILVLSVIVIFALLLTALSAWIGDQANVTLREARDNLEQKVEDRTHELQQSEKKLLQINKQSDAALDLTNAGYWHISFADDPDYYISSEKAVAIFGDPPRPDHRYHIMDEWYANVSAGDQEAAENASEKFYGAIEGRYPLYDATFAYRRPIDETIIWVRALAYVTRDENKKPLYMYGVTQDITESKTLENELREAQKKAEAANSAKSLFISSMSHEIRTPMNAVLGYSQILGRDKGLNVKQKKGVESIHRAGKHLLNIINDILDFSKIESGKLELHPHDFNLGGLVQELLSIFSEKCKEKKLELRSEGVQEGQKVDVYAEATKLKQVLINLIDNAVKFTEKGNVSLRVMPLSGDQFYFEVKDTGQGIPSEKLKDMFESFQQDEQGVKKGGVGLGLVISKKIISAMGGELEVESELGKGSKFFFSIDLPPAKEDVKEKDDQLEKVIGLAPGSLVKAVLIDDNRDNLNVLAETLKEIGVETKEAEGGMKGLEKIDETKPDIIFVDYQMPGMNGLEVTNKVKEEYGEDQIKIVMISASTFDHHREQFMKEGVDGFVGKPFIREEILGIMDRLLDIEYEYEAGPSSTEMPVEEDLDFSTIKLPEDLLSSIKEMASMGMMTELEELLKKMDKMGSDESRLARHIADLADQFDADGIVKLLQKMEC
jgi:signal transduction histidine kinase/ABC-type amino acid transport substrate-binding protein/CheY-like chemotaxis protein